MPKHSTISPGTPSQKAGDVIDRYRLLQRIGEGGVGVVWMAQQEQPLRRLVAFKVIKLGMDTKAVVARVEASARRWHGWIIPILQRFSTRALRARAGLILSWTSPVEPGALLFSAAGLTLAAAGPRGNQLVRWRVPTGEPSAVTAGAGSGPGGVVAVASAGRLAAREISRDGRDQIQVFDLVTDEKRWSAVSLEERVYAFAFSPAGALLAAATGNTGSSICLSDTTTGQLLGRLDRHRTYIAALLFWPDSKTLASAGTDQTVRLWDVEKRVLRRTLRGHELEVHRLALLPDNTTLVSGAKDGAVLLWDTAAPVATRQVSFDSVASWRAAPDGYSILIVDQAGVIIRRSGRDFERAGEPIGPA